MGPYNPQAALVWGQDLSYSSLDIYRPYIARSNKRIAIFCKTTKGEDLADINLPNIDALWARGLSDTPQTRFDPSGHP